MIESVAEMNGQKDEDWMSTARRNGEKRAWLKEKRERPCPLNYEKMKARKKTQQKKLADDKERQKKDQVDLMVVMMHKNRPGWAKREKRWMMRMKRKKEQMKRKTSVD